MRALGYRGCGCLEYELWECEIENPTTIKSMIIYSGDWDLVYDFWANKEYMCDSHFHIFSFRNMMSGSPFEGTVVCDRVKLTKKVA